MQDESGPPEPNQAAVQSHQLPSEISPATDEDLREEEKAAEGLSVRERLSRFFRSKRGSRRRTPATIASGRPSPEERPARGVLRFAMTYPFRHLGPKAQLARRWLTGRGGRGGVVLKRPLSIAGSPVDGSNRDASTFLQNLYNTVGAVRIASESVKRRQAAGAGPQETEWLKKALQAKRVFLSHLLGQEEEMMQRYPDSRIDIDIIAELGKTALDESANV